MAMAEILESLSKGSANDRAAIVRKHKSQLKTHYARLYLSDPGDAVRDALESIFLTIGKDGRAKVGATLATALHEATSDAERTRALRGLAYICHVDTTPPAAMPIIALAASSNAAVRAMALRCLWLLPADEITDAVRNAFAQGLADSSSAVRDEALAALHHAAAGYIYMTVDRTQPTFRAICRGGAIAVILDGLLPFVREGSKQEQARALEIIETIGADARLVALDLARAFVSTKHNAGYFGAALLAIGTLPEDARPLLEEAATKSAEKAEHADDVLKAAFEAVVPVGERVAQIEQALATGDKNARTSALYVAASLGPDGRALIPALQAHGAAIAAKNDTELWSTRDALRALGVPAEELPHPPSRLEAFRGAVPTGAPTIEDGYAIATFSTVTSEAPPGLSLGSAGVWDNKSGKVLLVVDGAEHIRIVPGRQEAFAVRTEGGRSSKGVWYLERYELPSGTRLTSVPVRGYSYGWVGHVEIAEQRDGLVATVTVGDEDRTSRFKVRIASGREPDTLVEAKRATTARPAAAKSPRPTAPKKSAKKPAPKKPAKKPAKNRRARSGVGATARARA